MGGRAVLRYRSYSRIYNGSSVSRKNISTLYQNNQLHCITLRHEAFHIAPLPCGRGRHGVSHPNHSRRAGESSSKTSKYYRCSQHWLCYDEWRVSIQALVLSLTHVDTLYPEPQEAQVDPPQLSALFPSFLLQRIQLAPSTSLFKAPLVAPQRFRLVRTRPSLGRLEAVRLTKRISPCEDTLTRCSSNRHWPDNPWSKECHRQEHEDFQSACRVRRRHYHPAIHQRMGRPQ